MLDEFNAVDPDHCLTMGAIRSVFISAVTLGVRGWADLPVVGDDARGHLDGVAAPVRYSQNKSESGSVDGAGSHQIAGTAFC